MGARLPHLVRDCLRGFRSTLEASTVVVRRARRSQRDARSSRERGGRGDHVCVRLRRRLRHDIVVEKIVPAAPGVAYPRCTGGRGDESPDDDLGGIRAFNAQRAEDAAEDGPPFFPWMDKIDPEMETESLEHLAAVIIPQLE